MTDMSADRVEYFYWEILELLRRTILVGWVLRLPDDRVFLRTILATVTSICSLTLLLSTHPYVRSEDSLLAAATQLALVLSFLGAGYVRLFNDFSLFLDEAVVRYVMAFDSTAQVVIPLISVTLGMLVVMVGIVVKRISMEGSTPTIRIVETGVAPELTVEKGHKWHLFLSHVVRSPTPRSCPMPHPHFSLHPLLAHPYWRGVLAVVDGAGRQRDHQAAVAKASPRTLRLLRRR